MTLVDGVVAAHGGLERWRRMRSLSLRLSSGGLAFATKGQPHALRDITATIATTGRHMALEGAGWAHGLAETDVDGAQGHQGDEPWDHEQDPGDQSPGRSRSGSTADPDTAARRRPSGAK